MNSQSVWVVVIVAAVLVGMALVCCVALVFGGYLWTRPSVEGLQPQKYVSNGQTIYFTGRNQQGQRIPEYVSMLFDYLQEERGAALTELASLREHIEHIERIVSAQQMYARTGGVVERMSLPELVDMSLTMTPMQQEVELVCEYENVPELQTDRHKVLQILANLVRNAGQALRDSGRSDRRLTVQIHRAGEARVRVIVADNGVGIPAENLEKVFRHGFTTRQDGHGFGLHAAANAAGELGGSLRASSEGAGRGASFTLELPLAWSQVGQAEPRGAEAAETEG